MGTAGKHQPPPEGDHEPWRRIIIPAAVQGLTREALVILLREVWRIYHW